MLISNPQISVVIPAHNEENYLPKCLTAISKSRDQHSLDVETVVVLNRCTDRTEQIASEFGAKIVREDTKNIARIRNVGVRASNSHIVVTIDADSYMAQGTLDEILELLSNPKIVAGGADFQPERKSIPILLSYGISKLMAKRAGGSMALYWFRRPAFEAIGGFDEKRPLGEDIDFSSRLRTYAESIGCEYSMLKSSHVVTSCRKFDQFGDWYAIKLALFGSQRVKSMMDGTNDKDMDTYYYESRSGQRNKESE
ncbi:MAG: glycosyltransferase [Pseudomonadales bacterium]